VSWSQLVFIILCFCQGTVESKERIDCTGTFSNMHYNVQGGDLLGGEIKIVVGSPTTRGAVQYKGVFQYAGGGPFDPVIVDVRCRDGRVSFTLPEKSGLPGAFDGTITSKGLEGVLRHREGHEEELDLPRRASYWDGPMHR